MTNPDKKGGDNYGGYKLHNSNDIFVRSYYIID